MKCLQFFRGFDYLSNEVKLTIRKSDTRLKTLFGGFLSILSVVITVSFGIYFFIQLIEKSNTYVTVSTEASQYSNLTDSNNYPFLIRLTDKNNKPFTDPKSVYSIALKYWYGGSNSTLEMVGQKTIDIDIEPCDLDKHFASYRSLFEDVTDLNTFYCPKPRPYTNTIYGKYGGIYPFGYYHFYVTMCYNKDYCLPLNEVKTITENVYLDFRTIDYTINSLSKNPKIQTVLTDRYMLSSTVYKRLWFYLSGIRYITDTGLFFSTTEEEDFSQFDSMRYDIDHRDIFTGTIPGTFVTMTVLNTGTVYIYNRKYLKLQEYIATVGGIVKFVQIVAFMINYIYARNSYNMKLIEELHILQKLGKSEPTPEKPLTIMKSNLQAFTVEQKLDMNESKEHMNTSQFKNKFLLNGKIKKWYYRLLPIGLLPGAESLLLHRCSVLVNTNMNIINILSKIEQNQFFLKDLMSDGEMNYSFPKEMAKTQLRGIWRSTNAITAKLNPISLIEKNDPKENNIK